MYGLGTDNLMPFCRHKCQHKARVLREIVDTLDGMQTAAMLWLHVLAIKALSMSSTVRPTNQTNQKFVAQY